MDYILLGLFTAALVGLICGVLIGVALQKWAQPDPEEIDGFPSDAQEQREDVRSSFYPTWPNMQTGIADETRGWIFGNRVTLNSKEQTAKCDLCGFVAHFDSDVSVMRDHGCASAFEKRRAFNAAISDASQASRAKGTV